MEDKASTWEIALLRLGMPFSRYLLFFSLPATVIGLIAGLTVWYTVSDVISGLGAAFLILLFPVLALSATILFPIAQVSAEAIQLSLIHISEPTRPY